MHWLHFDRVHCIECIVWSALYRVSLVESFSGFIDFGTLFDSGLDGGT